MRILNQSVARWQIHQPSNPPASPTATSGFHLTPELQPLYRDYDASDCLPRLSDYWVRVSGSQPPRDQPACALLLRTQPPAPLPVLHRPLLSLSLHSVPLHLLSLLAILLHTLSIASRLLGLTRQAAKTRLAVALTTARVTPSPIDSPGHCCPALFKRQSPPVPLTRISNWPSESTSSTIVCWVCHHRLSFCPLRCWQQAGLFYRQRHPSSTSPTWRPHTIPSRTWFSLHTSSNCCSPPSIPIGQLLDRTVPCSRPLWTQCQCLGSMAWALSRPLLASALTTTSLPTTLALTFPLMMAPNIQHQPQLLRLQRARLPPSPSLPRMTHLKRGAGQTMARVITQLREGKARRKCTRSQEGSPLLTSPVL
jgi:hypothetical protein